MELDSDLFATLQIELELKMALEDEPRFANAAAAERLQLAA